jgi:alpha-beta hydrolase superfamily lysophospholipase
MSTSEEWKKWQDFFESQGYQTYAPEWPYADVSLQEMNNEPDPNLEKTNFTDLLDHYKKFIKGLDKEPILIGHSLGGIVVQKLLYDKVGIAGICINSGPPKGIFKLNLDFLISNAQLVNPLHKGGLTLMSPKWYHKYVTNEMSFEETVNFMNENCVPSSTLIAKSSAELSHIDFSAAHKPLLFIAGSKDRSQPATINLENYNAYTDKESLKTFKEFPGRTHNSINMHDWKEIANYINGWLNDPEAD